MFKKVLLVFCLSFSIMSNAQDDKPFVDLHHWWQMPSEQMALDEIVKSLIENGAQVEKFVLDDFEAHRASIIERVGFGYLPAITHWLAGSELMALKAEGVLTPLEDLIDQADVEELSKFLYPEVVSEITRNNEFSALPVGIHVQSTAFFSTKIYDELNLDLPENWDEFIMQAPLIQEAGYTPLAVSDFGWQIGFLVDSFLLDKGGVEGIQAVRYGKGDLQNWRILLVDLFDFLKKVKLYANPKWANNAWNENSKLVGEGRAAMQVIGDYVEAVMNYNGYKYGQDYEYTLAPGNDKAMVYGVDVFALLQVDDQARINGQQLMVETMLDSQVQKRFIAKKGGLPVRNDVDVSQLNEGRENLYKLWRNKDITKIKMPGGNSRLRFKALESMALDVWMNPEKFDSGEMANKFIELIKSVE